MLSLDNLSVCVGDRQWLYSKAFETKGTYALLGRSGSGKTTLLNTIAGFTAARSGQLRWNNTDIIHLKPSDRPITSLFQQNNLFNHLTVIQNIGLGICPSLKLNENQKQQIKQILIQVGLPNYEKRLPLELSGGEQQRVALARCMLRRKPVLLLDEPFSALDAVTRSEMATLLKELISDHELCTILVTHDPKDAERLEAETITLTNEGLV